MPVINCKIVDARNLERNKKKTIKIWHTPMKFRDYHSIDSTENIQEGYRNRKV